MAIKILKEGRKIERFYAGICSECDCQFEIPYEEAHNRQDFSAFLGGPKMDCPNCGWRLAVKLETRPRSNEQEQEPEGP